jgi:hypothetical protein
MPEYGLPADGPDVFRNFVIPVPVVSTRWVEAVEFRPTNRRVVHHAVIQIDEDGASRHLDEEDLEPSYEGMFARNTSHHPDGFLMGEKVGDDRAGGKLAACRRMAIGTFRGTR